MISARSGRSDVTDILVEGEHIDLDIQENVRIYSVHVYTNKYTFTYKCTYPVTIILFTYMYMITKLCTCTCYDVTCVFVCVCVSTLHHYRALDGLLSTLQLREGT